MPRSFLKMKEKSPRSHRFAGMRSRRAENLLHLQREDGDSDDSGCQTVTMRRLLVPLGLTLLLAGCTAAPPSIPPLPEPTETPAVPDSAPAASEPITIVDQYSDLPPGAVFDETFAAGWVPDSAGRIAIVTFGSSSCPVQPVSYDLESTDALSLWAEYTGDSEVCTADMAATTFVIEVPAGFADDGDVLINNEPAPRLD